MFVPAPDLPYVRDSNSEVSVDCPKIGIDAVEDEPLLAESNGKTADYLSSEALPSINLD